MIHALRPVLSLVSFSSVASATWLVVDSFTEHFDVVKGILIVTLSIVAWFLIDLKLRVERVQREHGEEIKAHGIDIAQLKADGRNRQSLLDRLADALTQHMQDEHRYQTFAMPRLYELTKHIEHLSDPDDVPKLDKPKGLRNTGDLRRQVREDESEPQASR